MCDGQFTVPTHNYRPDWMSGDLIEQFKDRVYFYKQAKRTGDKDRWNIEKYLRNVTNSNIRQAKRDFVLNQLKQSKNNPKRFWKTIRSVIPHEGEILLRDGSRKLERHEVASIIKDYFINVGKVSLGDSSTVRKSGETPSQGGGGEERGFDAFSLEEVHEGDVRRVSKSINISKSSGLDNINSSVIRMAFEVLVPETTCMYNLSIEGTYFPNSWKTALVVPIPIQGNLTKVQNYRPILLLPLPGKILEKLIHKQLSDYLEGEELLADVQHGFCKNHSTQHYIAQVINFINKNLDVGLPTAAVFIDFRKAFDCVQHPVLLEKMKVLGFSDTVISWVKSYLSDRKQRVFANSTYSDFQNITQGVPQGSVLGPLFYIIYANDIAKIVKNWLYMPMTQYFTPRIETLMLQLSACRRILTHCQTGAP